MDQLGNLSQAIQNAIGWILSESWIPPRDFELLKWLSWPTYGAIMLGVVALELIRPYQRHKFGRETVLTGIYFVFAFKVTIFVVLLVPALTAVWVNQNLPSLHLDRVLPLPLYMLLGLLAITFVDYWSHRLLHRIPLLWHIHKIHHAPKNLNWATRYHQHFGMEILHAPLWTVTSLFLGTELVAPFGLIMITIDYFQHANIDFNFRWLNYVISTPQVHRYHHSTNPAHYDTNFGGTLVLWDQLFGTYTFDAKNPATEFGLDEEIPQSSIRQQILPLVWIGRDVKRMIGSAPGRQAPAAALEGAIEQPTVGAAGGS